MSKKKKRLLIITVVTLLVALAIVATVLIVVKYNEKKRNDGYVTLEQLKKSVIPDKTYDNLDLSNAVLNMPQFDDIYDIKWQLNNTYTKEECLSGCEKLGNEVLSRLNQRGTDMSTIYYCDDFLNESPDGKPLYDDFGFATINYVDKTTLEDYNYTTYGGAELDTNGTLYFICQPQNTDFYGIVRKNVRIDLGEQPSDKMYRTINGEMSEKQAVEIAEQEGEKYSEYLGTDLSVACLLVKQGTDESIDDQTQIIDEDNGNPYYFTVIFNKEYEGVPFFSNGEKQYMDSAEEDSGKTIFRQPQMYIDIYENSGASYILSLNGYPVVTEATKHKENKYISLQTACDKISELFAPRSEHVIDEISFNYALEFEFDDEDGSIHQALPCWCFSTYYLQSDNVMLKDTIYVDAVTGDIYFRTDDSPGYFKSDETDGYIK